MALNASLRGYISPVGAYGLMVWDALRFTFKRGAPRGSLSRSIVKFGVESLPIVLLTALFTGMVLALQTAYGLGRFGAKNYVGNIAGLAFVRELGPILTSIVLCGRVGAGVAAELASMSVSEQIDAMKALGAHPAQKLVGHRIIAGMIATPLLTVLADVVGIYGGLLVSVYDLNLSTHLYFHSLMLTIKFRDITDGLIKALVFGFLISSISCFHGLRAYGGTEGVGRTTTKTVVIGIMWLFISDYIVTKLLLMLW